jgi:heme/copper-type cytochrome/quinol oxidase subunit 4
VREEFKFRTAPIAWPAFTLFLILYAAGFAEGSPGNGNLFSSRLLIAFFIACGLTYLTILTERKDPVAYRRMIKEAKDRRWLRLIEKAPCWMLTLPFVVVTAIFFIAFTSVAGENVGRLSPVFIMALVAFLGRDIALFNFFNLGERTKRADMLVILWLSILYGLIPGIFMLLRMEAVTALFWPRTDYAFLSCIAALCQLFAAWRLTLTRWRNKHSIV